MEFWGEMDDRREIRHIRSIPGREPEFVTGIENEGLDFSQFEEFMNSEGSQGNNAYFESLNSATPPSGANVIVENNRRNTAGHSLPESPPDSSSEHPYSPQEGCDATLTPSDSLYTTIMSPILNSNMILDQNSDQLLSNALQDGRIIVSQNGDNTLLLADDNRQILLTNPDANQNYDAQQQQHLVHLGYNQAIEVPIGNDGALDNIQTVYTNLQSAPKKRKLSQDTPLVKSEPEHCSTSQLSPPGPLSVSLDEEYASSEACLSDPQFHTIKFGPFQQLQWHTLCDQNLTELRTPDYGVVADKGFNFSNADDAFVCQKKNHFQITCQVRLSGDPQFVKTPDGLQKISSFYLHFYGVKHDCPTQTIRVEQSQSDRSKKPFHPVLVEFVNSQVTKVTVGRLHFSETTSNNMRKKGKPNPEQRYFQLVVGLHAHTTTGNFPVVSHASQKIIVRASNPGQFESDVELCWQKGQTQDSVFHNGKIGINTDRPDESLVVHGNIKITGHIIQPSDIRAKKNIIECDTAQQLRNVQKLRVVRYDYEPSFASQLSRDSQRSDTGVIAQEVAKILPEAVRPAGDLILKNGTSIDNFLVVNKERIFMENIGAVKELCKVTNNLENRIDQLERINRRLNKLKRGDSLKSNSTVSSSKLSYTQKCQKRDDELCSNKFIHIVIVVLVLIMACCLAAITALYLLEASRHNQLIHANQQTPRRASNMVTKRPSKLSKGYASRHTMAPHHSVDHFKDEAFTQITFNPADVINRQSSPIGRPQDCASVDQNLENANLCQLYCCALTAPSSIVIAPPELSDKNAQINSNNNNNKTSEGLLHNSEKNNLARPLHSNDLEKPRQKRDSDVLSDDEFERGDDDRWFSVTVQGRSFNTTLSSPYYQDVNNFTYHVPISKYMPDEYVKLIFRPTVNSSITDIVLCYHDNNDEPECLSGKSKASQFRHKVNEFNPIKFRTGAIFEVDMMDHQRKHMRYRAPLRRQNQNVCNMTTPGDFIEYNIKFYRRCDE